MDNSKNKCTLNFKKIGKPKSTAKLDDNRIIYVGKKDIDGAYLPAVTVCQQTCIKKDYVCPSAEATYLVALSDKGSFYLDIETLEKIEDGEAAGGWGNSNLNTFPFKKSDLAGFNGLFAENATRDGNVLSLNIDSNGSIAAAAQFDLSEGCMIIVFQNEPINNIITIGAAYTEDMFLGIIFGGQTVGTAFIKDNQGVDAASLKDLFFTKIATVDGANAVMFSWGKDGVVSLTVNGIRTKYLLEDKPVSLTYQTFLNVSGIANLTGTFKVKDFYIFDRPENQDIRNYYNSLLTKYNINEEIGPDLFLTVYRDTPKETEGYNWHSFIEEENRLFYQYSMRGYICKNRYSLSEDNESTTFGDIILGLTNNYSESMTLKNVTFDPAPPSNLTAGFSINKYSEAEEESEIGLEFPIEMEPTGGGGNNISYTILSYPGVTYHYVGTMTLHITFRGKDYEINLPVDQEIVS